MLSINPIKSASVAAQYYRDKDNYYLSDKDSLDRQAKWLGKGAEILGLIGEVETKYFIDVLTGRLPNGEEICSVKHGTVSHRPGIDVTFSPSKSVSLLGLLGGDNRLLGAHHEAVQFTMERLERDLAEARVTHGGITAYEKTKNLVMATFPHSTSRELDPQIHTHVVILNATQRADGAWRALSSRHPKDRVNWDKGFNEGVYRDQHYYGLIYTSQMAANVKSLGYDIQIKDKYGNFDVKGIAPELLDHFSKRSDQIKQKLLEKNLTGARAAEIAALDSRQLKQALDNNTLRSYWQDQLKVLGCDLGPVIAKSYQTLTVRGENETADNMMIKPDGDLPRPQSQPILAPDETTLMPNHGIDEREQPPVISPENKEAPAIPEARETIISPTLLPSERENGELLEKMEVHNVDPKVELSKHAAGAAVKEAIEHLSLFNVTLRHADLVRQAFRFLNPERLISVDDIEAAILSCHQNKILLGKISEYYTTKSLTDIERKLIAKSKSLLGNSWSSVKRDQSVVAGVLHRPDRVQLVEADGARAERKQLQQLVTGCDHRGRSVRVLHMSRLQCNQLAREVKRPGETLWQWLRNSVRPELVQTVSQYRHQIAASVVPLFGRRSPEVVIVTDAQKLSLSDLDALLDLARTEDSKLILSHNTSGLDGHTAGNCIALLKKAGIFVSQEKWRAEKSIMELKEASDPVIAAVEHYLSLPFLERESAQLVAPTRGVKDTMNRSVRSQLLRENTLNHESQTLNVLSGRTLTIPEQRHTESYHLGDRLTFKAFTPEQRHYRVIDKTSTTLRLKNDKGVVSDFSLKNSEEFRVEKTRDIAINIGEQIFLPRGYFSQTVKFDPGTVMRVKQFDGPVIVIEANTRAYRLPLATLSEHTIDHNYVRRLGEVTGSPRTIITALSGYQINKQQVSELTGSAERITVFTEDRVKAQAQCEKSQVRWLASDVAAQKPASVRAYVSHAEQSIWQDLNVVAKQLTDLDPAKLTQTAVAYAMAKLGEREAAFDHKSLLTTAMQYALGDVTLDKIEAVINAKIVSGELIHAKTYWVTPEAIKLEKSIVGAANAGINKSISIVRENSSHKLPEFLTADQRNAIHLITTSCDRTVAIQGFAGSGKTTMMKCVKTIAQSEGYQLQGLAPTHEAVERLQSESGIPAITAHRFLSDHREFTQKTLFIIDECSMLGNRVFHEVQKRLETLDAKAVFCGDIAQNPAVESGRPQTLLLHKSDVKFVTMREIIRQKDQPILKETAYLAAAAKAGESIKKLSSLDPSKTIEWQDEKVKTHIMQSVVEVDRTAEDKKGKNYSAIYDTAAELFLSRVISDQKRTLVVAHAHEDRHHLDDRIREGLKLQRQIEHQESEHTCLTSRNLDRVDCLFSKNYEVGDVIRCDKAYGAFRRGDYLTVKARDNDKNSLSCYLPSVSKTLRLNPAKNALKANFSVYARSEKPIAIGDRLRLRRTDVKKGWQANREYTVDDLRDNAVYCTGEKGRLIIHPDDLSEAHWEYAYTSTSYGVQGNDDRFVLGVELVKRENATTWKDHYVTVTRGREGCLLVTDDKAGLMKRLDSLESQHRAEKLSALSIKEGEHANKKAHVSEAIPNGPLSTKNVDTQQKTSPAITLRLDAKVIGPLLTRDIDRLAVTLLGDPNRHLSSPKQWRYGNKGSLAINRETGGWVNFESGEKGNVFSLIKEAIGIQDFKEALKYGADFLRYSPDLPATKTRTSSDKLHSMKPDEGMLKKARDIMQGVKPIKGSLAETYLTSHRGVDLPISANLAYHPQIYTRLKDGSHSKAPALIAYAKDDKGELKHIEIHRLDPISGNKHQTAKIQRQSYGSKAGVPVSLNPKSTSSTRYIVEGVVTGLSLLTVKPEANVDAYLGKGNFANIQVDSATTHVVLCVDNDGSATYTKSMVATCDRLEKLGKQVTLMIPDQSGQDLNDVLKIGGKAALEKLLTHHQTTAKYKLSFETICAGKSLRQENSMLKSLHDKLEQASGKTPRAATLPNIPPLPTSDFERHSKVYQAMIRQDPPQPLILPEQVRDK